MATVRVTPHLRRFFDVPTELESPAGTVADLLTELDARWPGIAFYIADERGALRKHVAIWVDGQQVQDPATLSDALQADSSVTILQALSGG